jgi:peptidoglycan/xylan/chitin deacetylase (PgdA/CDA1 family)
MKYQAVQRGRSVADDGISKSIETLAERTAGVVGLPVGEPVEWRAHDHLHICSRARSQERTLEATLTATYDDHASGLVCAVILKIGCEPHVISDLPVERSRRRCERHSADSDDQCTDVDLVAPVSRQPESPVRPFDGSDVCCIDVPHEGRAEPVGIAEELLERYRLLAGLVGRRRPAIERSGIVGRGEGRLVPVRPKAHVRRHAGPPRPHGLAVRPNPTSVAKLGRDGEPVGTGTENRDVQALDHVRTEAAKNVSSHQSGRMRVPLVRYPLKASVTRARSAAWLVRARSVALAQGGVRVLFYHRVADDRDELAVSPRRFRHQMDFLAAEGYAVLDITQVGALLRTGRVPERAVGLTFDDGCRDVAEHALPVLAEHGFRATVFVSTGVTDGRTSFAWYARQPPLLTWSDITELDRGGTLGFEAHSLTHPNLLVVDDVQAEREIAGSKAELEDRLGRRVTAFSYPSGLFGERERRLVDQAGYALAVSCEPGINVPTTDRFALRRRQIDARDSLLDFRAKVAGGHDTPLPLRGLYRRVRYGDGRVRPLSASARL